MRFFSKKELQTIRRNCDEDAMYEDAYDLLNPNKYPPLNHPIDVDEESVQTSYETFTQREIKKTDKKQNHQLGRALTLGKIR